MDRALNAALNAGSPDVIVVLQTGSKLARRVAETVRIVYNPEPRNGISGSMRISVDSVSGSTDAVLFTLADQPFVSASMLRRLIDTAEKSSAGIISYSVGGDPRNPALFKSRYFPELISIKGDRGGKVLIKGHEDDAILIQAQSPACLFDVDTPETLEEAQRILSSAELVCGAS